MKQIIIALLIIIVLIFGFNQYKQYKRFHSPGIDYKSNEKIDLKYHDQAFLLNYYEAIEDLNGCVREKWSVEGIDVRNSKDDDNDVKAAIGIYTKKLGKVKFYEDRLIHSLQLKNKGLTDNDVKAFEESGLKKAEYNDFVKAKFLKETFKSDPNRYSLKVGDYSPFVYELQKVLVKKGFQIPVDGLFRDNTFEALKSFEQRNGLFADGKINAITLDYLMR